MGLSCYADWSCQCIKLVGKRDAIVAVHREPALGNHMHKFDAGKDGLRRAKRLEPEHRRCDALDGTMILFHGIVE